MTRRVLVTRSQPGADATATELSARGIEPVVAPLLSLEPIAAEIPSFDALAFTSVNAVRQFRELSPWRTGPVWCVGDRTAAEARESGYQDVRSASGSVAELAALLLEELPADTELLHAGNEESRGDLSGTLTRHGRKAAFLPIYRTVDLATPGSALSAILDGSAELDCALIHSPKAARVLARMVQQGGTKVRFPVASISENASHELSELGFRVITADHPNEQALLLAMDRAFLVE